MRTDEFQIIPYQDGHRQQLLAVWEKSVLATHHFLEPNDFEAIKTAVHGIDFNEFEVYCLVAAHEVAGFIGLDADKVEMLFLSPEYFGKGLGKKLMNFAINDRHAQAVDVNEQNLQAVAFYQRLGFEAYDRTETDGMGMAYPILKMRLLTS